MWAVLHKSRIRKAELLLALQSAGASCHSQSAFGCAVCGISVPQWEDWTHAPALGSDPHLLFMLIGNSRGRFLTSLGLQHLPLSNEANETFMCALMSVGAWECEQLYTNVNIFCTLAMNYLISVCFSYVIGRHAASKGIYWWLALFLLKVQSCTAMLACFFPC